MNAWLQQVFDALPDHIAVLDVNGNIIAVNQAWQCFAHDNGAKSAETFVGSNYLKVCQTAQGMDIDLARACYQVLLEVLAAKCSEFSLEYPCHTPNLQGWFLLRARPFEGGVVVVHTDISQLKQKAQNSVKLQDILLTATSNLLTQEVTPEFYQHLLEQAVALIPGAQAGSVTVRGQDNRFHFVAAVGFDLAGLSEVSFDENELSHAEQRLPTHTSYLVYGLNAINLKVLDARRIKQLQEAGHTQRIKVTLGVPIVIANQVSAHLNLDNFEDENAFDQDTRQSAEIIGVHVGLVLQLLRDKVTLTKSELLFSTLFHQSPAPTFLSSLSTNQVRDANQSFLELVGYDHHEVVGKEVMKLPFFIDEHASSDATTLRAGRAILQAERTIRSKSGTLHITLGSSVPVEVEGEPCILTTLIDITEHKRTEEQLTQAIQAVMQDAQWFSHSVMQKLAQMNFPDRKQSEITELTEREHQVLALVATGKNNTHIGKRLGISAQTVRNYVSQIYSKLGVDSRAEAVVWARERGIVT